jgi:predicted transcriptional regulator
MPRKRPPLSLEEIASIKARALAGETTGEIATALGRSTRAVDRVKVALGLNTLRAERQRMTEAEIDRIGQLCKQGLSVQQICATTRRSQQSVLKAIRLKGLQPLKQMRGVPYRCKLRALSFVGLGYSTAKVAKLCGITQAQLRQWLKEDADTPLPKQARKVAHGWRLVEVVEGTESWQCEDTGLQIALTRRTLKQWLLLDPWSEEIFTTRLAALDRAKGLIHDTRQHHHPDH